MTEAEARAFWDSHAVTDEYLATMPAPLEDGGESGRHESPSRYVAIHVQRDVFQSARELARRRGVRVDDLLQLLVEQGLSADDEQSRATGS